MDGWINGWIDGCRKGDLLEPEKMTSGYISILSHWFRLGLILLFRENANSEINDSL